MEIWKPITNYDGFYEVSNYGIVRSVERTINKITYKQKFINGEVIKKGYIRVTLSKNGTSERFLVHRIVANEFIGNSQLKVNHKDFNKSNNHVSNLEYVSDRENTAHYIKSKLLDLPIGVRKMKNKYQARFWVKNKVFYLGVFDTPQQAGDAYNCMLKSL